MRSLLTVVVFLFVTPSGLESGDQSSARVNLSGQWFMDKTGAAANGPRVFWIVCGWECALTQDDRMLLVKSDAGRETTFRLDGVPETSVSTWGEFKAETTRSARMSGTTLIITSRTGRFQTTTTLLLEGNRLVVEVRSTGRGGEPQAVRSVYQRRLASR